MLVCILIFAVFIVVGGLCPRTPLGAQINRAVLEGWRVLTSGRMGWKALLVLAAVLIFAALAQGTPFIFAIGAVADAAAYIDLVGLVLAASAARLVFVAAREARTLVRPMARRAVAWMHRVRRRAGRSGRPAAARLGRQPDVDDEPSARRLGFA